MITGDLFQAQPTFGQAAVPPWSLIIAAALGASAIISDLFQAVPSLSVPPVPNSVKSCEGGMNRRTWPGGSYALEDWAGGDRPNKGARPDFHPRAIGYSRCPTQSRKLAQPPALQPFIITLQTTPIMICSTTENGPVHCKGCAVCLLGIRRVSWVGLGWPAVGRARGRGPGDQTSRPPARVPLGP